MSCNINKTKIINMKNIIGFGQPDRGLQNIQENYEIDYWNNKYGVSTEELKNSANKKGLAAKIIEAITKKQELEPVA